MDLNFYTARMDENRRTFSSLLSGVGDEQAHWRPAPEKWSLVEVVNHLHDEEREDFRARLDIALNRPAEVWPAIDPVGWVAARGYNERGLDESLADFLREREASLEWLRGLRSPDWARTSTHPRGRTLAAGDLLASWLAHDFFHLRQMANLHWLYLDATAAPYRTEYSGPF
jgi:hypothetical protein